MPNCTLSRHQTALLIVDMQEKNFATVERHVEVLQVIIKMIRGFEILNLPIFISEQYPQGLGSTIKPLQEVLKANYRPWIKSTFSCMDDPDIAQHIAKLSFQQWILVGMEAHICVLQTSKGLLKIGRQVIILNDAIASRSIYDFSTAIAEMRDEGVRISSAETVLFELLRDSRAPEFKQINQLVKVCCH